MNKKVYQQPLTQSVTMKPASILCASVKGILYDPNAADGLISD